MEEIYKGEGVSMNSFKDELSPMISGWSVEQTCQRKDGELTNANNQVWSDLEDWLLEQIRIFGSAWGRHWTGALIAWQLH